MFFFWLPKGYLAHALNSNTMHGEAVCSLSCLQLSVVLFDLLFLRLNPFICLFDPSLHSVSYVRSRSRFLFTTLIMAGCKFFRPELYHVCAKMANDLAIRAFTENWISVEVVQAFACLCYWKEPEDTVRDSRQIRCTRPLTFF